jgi:hypothetical protein
MPRDGSLVLSDVHGPTLAIVYGPRGRRGRYNVEGLAEHGKLTDLLARLADCPKARSVSVHDRCTAVYEGLPLRTPAADAPLLKRALGGPSDRIFLNAAREIAGILEKLVEREAEREQPLDLGGRKRARQAFAPQRRDFGVAALERGVESLKRWRSAPAGEFIGAAKQELASLAAETGKRRGKTLSDGAGKRLGGRADEDHEIMSES